MAGIFNSSIFNDAIFNTAEVEVEDEVGGASVRGNLQWASGLRRDRDEDEREEYDEEDDVSALLLVS